jgi:Ca2+-binding RTX toxin-like protein
VLYTPSPGYTGPDTFAYTVRDNGGAVSNQAIVTLNVIPNQPPVAADDSADVQQNSPTPVFVVGNDFDPDGSIDFTSIVITQAPSHGTATTLPVGSFPPGFVLYTPSPGYAGSDSFGYTVRDNSGAVSNQALVTLNIVPNQPPVAVDDSATVKENSTAFVFVVGNDFDPDGFIDFNSVVITQPPSHGTLGGPPGLPPPPGLVIYTPNPGYFGPDSFAYTVRDNSGAVSNKATVSISVIPNQPPTARNDSAQTMIGQTVWLDVLGNDSDPDGIINPSTLAIQHQPSHGSVTVDPFSRSVIYTPDCDFVGSDSFTYTVRDNDGAESNVATVTIDVLAVRLLDFGELQVFGTCGRDIVRIEPEGDQLVVHALLGMPSDGPSVGAGSKSQTSTPRNPDELRLQFPLAGVQHIFVSAGSGNDQITIAPQITLPSFVDGGEGDDWLRTGSGDDFIFDFSGNNRIEAGDGRDVIVTRGPIIGAPGNNQIDAGAGDDTIDAGPGNDTIDAGPGNDIVHAGGGNDTVDGGFGNDILLGGDGNDTVSGGAGRDLLIGGRGADQIVGNQDDDILIAGTTAYDDFNDFALRAILAEWTSDRSYDERVANLSTGIGPPALAIRLNGDSSPIPGQQTVFEDSDVDVLSGNQARDWFFANLSADNGGPLDKVTDKGSTESWLDTDLS